MTTSIDKLIAGLGAKKAGPQSFNGAVNHIAPKAIKGGTVMPRSPHERMAHARAAKGKMPKAVKVKPLNVGTRNAANAKGTGAVQVPSAIAPQSAATNSAFCPPCASDGAAA